MSLGAKSRFFMLDMAKVARIPDREMGISFWCAATIGFAVGVIVAFVVIH